MPGDFHKSHDSREIRPLADIPERLRNDYLPCCVADPDPIRIKVKSRIRIRIRIKVKSRNLWRLTVANLLEYVEKSPHFDEDPNLYKIKPDPDRDPDPHPHHSKKSDPDPRQSKNLDENLHESDLDLQHCFLVSCVFFVNRMSQCCGSVTF
jgi:hypothetical protein